jgi:hypothetical protein
MFFLISILGVGILSSFVGGLLGLGGGFLLVPLLTLQLGFDIKEAILMSLVALLWLGLVRTIQARHLVQEYRGLIRGLGGFTVIGSIISAHLGIRATSMALNILFGAILLCISVYFLWDRDWEPKARPASNRGLVIARFVFFGSGALGGLLGLGGGIFNIPVMHRFLHLPMTKATRLNFPFILISAASALAVFIVERRESVQELPLIPMIAMLVGTFIGATLSGRAKISSKNLKIIFALLLLLVGLIKLWTAIVPT